MSRKLPLYAVDKVALTVRVPAEVEVKLECMADQTGIAKSALAATGIANMVKDQQFGIHELQRVHDIISQNIKKRAQLKLRKGAL